VSQPTPVSPTSPSAKPTRPSFTRWVRSTSEHHLLVVAQAKVARRNGLVPPKPTGVDVFWQKVYAPVFYALPYALRAKVANAMPGSHRQTWHTPPKAKGPAV
jgi:hypothetical protein